MLAPCDCKGSIRYVHLTCLHQWRHQPEAPMRQRTHCNACGGIYKYIRIPGLSEVLWIGLKQITPGTILNQATAVFRHITCHSCNHVCCTVIRLLQTGSPLNFTLNLNQHNLYLFVTLLSKPPPCSGFGMRESDPRTNFRSALPAVGSRSSTTNPSLVTHGFPIFLNLLLLQRWLISTSHWTP